MSKAKIGVEDNVDHIRSDHADGGNSRDGLCTKHTEPKAQDYMELPHLEMRCDSAGNRSGQTHQLRHSDNLWICHRMNLQIEAWNSVCRARSSQGRAVVDDNGFRYHVVLHIYQNQVLLTLIKVLTVVLVIFSLQYYFPFK